MTDAGEPPCPSYGEYHVPSLTAPLDHWVGMAAENIENWGLQDASTLLHAMTEEHGELTRAYLEWMHEDGHPEEIREELSDLMALGIQLHARIEKNGETGWPITDGGRVEKPSSLLEGLPRELRHDCVIRFRNRCEPKYDCYQVVLNAESVPMDFRSQWKDDWEILGSAIETYGGQSRLRITLIERATPGIVEKLRGFDRP